MKHFIMIKYLLIILGIWASGCTKMTHPSVSRSYSEIDTVTQIVADSSLLFAFFECDSMNRVQLKEIRSLHGKMANNTLVIDSGRVVYKTRWQTKYIDRIKEIRDTITIIQQKEVVLQVRHIPRVYRWCFWACLLFLGTKLVKFFIKR